MKKHRANLPEPSIPAERQERPETTTTNLAGDVEKEPTSDRWIRRLKNRRSVALMIVIAAIVAGVAGFTNALKEIQRFYVDEPPRFALVGMCSGCILVVSRAVHLPLRSA